MKTAVEFIAQELSKQIDNNLFMEVSFNRLLEQAKEMEKEQIEDAFREGMLHHTSGLFANEYFDKTFKSEEDETDGQND